MATSNQVSSTFNRYKFLEEPVIQNKVPLEQLLKDAYERGYLEGCIDGKREGFEDGLRWATGK